MASRSVSILAAAFRIVETLVRAANQAGGAVAAGVVGDAEGDRALHRALLVRRDRQRADLIEDALGHGAGAAEVRVREDDRELVAAEAGEEVGRAQRLAHGAAELGEDDVADGVAERIVDLLEVVDVEHQERERQRVDAGALDLLRQLPAEVALVPDAGEVVGVGEVLDLLARGEVAEEHCHLRGEDLEELRVGLVERRVAEEEKQTGGAVFDLQNRGKIVFDSGGMAAALHTVFRGDDALRRDPAPGTQSRADALHDGRAGAAIVAPDGVAAAPDEDRDAYRLRREEESRHALSAPIDFFRFPDRSLDEHMDELAARLRDVLDEFRPDLILAPSAIEIHPDHLALSRAFCELVQRDASLF